MTNLITAAEAMRRAVAIAEDPTADQLAFERACLWVVIARELREGTRPVPAEPPQRIITGLPATSPTDLDALPLDMSRLRTGLVEHTLVQTMPKEGDAGKCRHCGHGIYFGQTAAHHLAWLHRDTYQTACPGSTVESRTFAEPEQQG